MVIVDLRYMSKKKTGDKKDKVVDKLIDNLVDEEDEDESQDSFVNIQDSQLNKFLSAKSSGGGKKVKGKGNVQKMRYDEFTQIVKGRGLYFSYCQRGCEAVLTHYFGEKW